MRILLLNDGPLAKTQSGIFLGQVARHALARGHAVHCLVADCDGGEDRDLTVHYVCDDTPGGDTAPFPVVGLDDQGRAFAALSDEQIAGYVERFRRALDEEIEQFNPQLVHVPHIWVQAHLVLEAGVPYVLSTWGDELDALAADARFRASAQQAAENASCIVSDSDQTQRRVRELFGELDNRLITVAWVKAVNATLHRDLALRPREALPDWDGLLNLYRQVIVERFGPSAEL